MLKEYRTNGENGRKSNGGSQSRKRSPNWYCILQARPGLFGKDLVAIIEPLCLSLAQEYLPNTYITNHELKGGV